MEDIGNLFNNQIYLQEILSLIAQDFTDPDEDTVNFLAAKSAANKFYIALDFINNQNLSSLVPSHRFILIALKVMTLEKLSHLLFDLGTDGANYNDVIEIETFILNLRKKLKDLSGQESSINSEDIDLRFYYKLFFFNGEVIKLIPNNKQLNQDPELKEFFKSLANLIINTLGLMSWEDDYVMPMRKALLLLQD